MYVFDTSSFSLLGNYFPNTFSGFWERFNALAVDGHVISVSEVYKELERQSRHEHLNQWCYANRGLFFASSEEETKWVARMFREQPSFHALISPQAILDGRPVADPFLIASSMIRGWCLVTEERIQGNKIRIPFICKHYGIRCINVEGMLQEQAWRFW